ncbi:MAG: STAS domain-containing protein [Deltaproteobacteria bacterium]|nr:STAS domain-containing protein [Deltaproteobacteria bacterium]
MFNATVTREGNIHVVYMRGRLNLVNSEDFSKVLQSLISEDNNEVILEMSELEYITSDGLKPILNWLQATRLRAPQGKRRLALCNLQDFVKTIFRHTGFDKQLPIYDSIHAAIRG